MTYLICAGLIVVGLLAIFAKDFMWQLTQMSNDMRGVASDRTETWDSVTTLGGIFAIVLGVVTLIIVISG